MPKHAEEKLVLMPKISKLLSAGLTSADHFQELS
jgi:hypothetical protein